MKLNAGLFNRCLVDSRPLEEPVRVLLRASPDPAGWLKGIRVVSTGGAPPDVVKCLVRQAGRIRSLAAAEGTYPWPRVEADIPFRLLPPQPAAEAGNPGLPDGLAAAAMARLDVGDGEGAAQAFDSLLERDKDSVQRTCSWLAGRIRAERLRAPWIDSRPFLDLAGRFRELVAGLPPRDPTLAACRQEAFDAFSKAVFDLFKLARGGGTPCVRDPADLIPMCRAALDLAPDTPASALQQYYLAGILGLLVKVDEARQQLHRILGNSPNAEVEGLVRDDLEYLERRPPTPYESRIGAQCIF